MSSYIRAYRPVRETQELRHFHGRVSGIARSVFGYEDATLLQLPPLQDVDEGIERLNVGIGLDRNIVYPLKSLRYTHFSRVIPAGQQAALKSIPRTYARMCDEKFRRPEYVSPLTVRCGTIAVTHTVRPGYEVSLAVSHPQEEQLQAVSAKIYTDIRSTGPGNDLLRHTPATETEGGSGIAFAALPPDTSQEQIAEFCSWVTQACLPLRHVELEEIRWQTGTM